MKSAHNPRLKACTLAHGAPQELSVAIKSKIEGLLLHVTQLDALFFTPPRGDVAEQRRREELKRVKGIEGQLLTLYEKLEPQRVGARAKDSEGMFMCLEDLQEVIFRYKMARQTAIDNEVLKSMVTPFPLCPDKQSNPSRQDPADAIVLNNFRYAQQAEYRHGNRGGCLKGTRSTILDKIELWKHNFRGPSIYWLNGLAGTGKSTIAQTIAERLFADGCLGASFFCSRDSEDRRNLQFIFPSLAVQLARKYPEFRSILVPLVRSDPEIANESLYGQMNKLIFRPLTESAISTVIVIDALDECRDEEQEPASAILSVLGQFVAEIPNVKFFVTGRPEPRVREGFRLPLLAKGADVFVLHEIELGQVNRDIRLFFTHEFQGLRDRRRGLGGWPTEEQLDLLCERAAGLFVYAMATIRFIDQRNGNPSKQLDRLLQVPEASALEGKTKIKLNTTLDLLYATILQEAFGGDDQEDDHKIRSVLGAVILATNPLPPSAIASLLNLDTDDVLPLLSSVHSLLVLHEDANHPVRPFHKSFPDFITDPARCSDPRFCIRPSNQHLELLIGCLELMNRRLEQDMCNLPTGTLNSEIDDTKERTEQPIDQALQYACRSWYRHLIQDVTPAEKLEIAPILHRFLETKFLFWLKVLSILGATREAVDALGLAAKWLDGLPPLDLVNDCFRFLLTFFDIISTSTAHIYISALPLSPQVSIIRKLYQKYARPLVRVIRGLPISWEPVTATAYHEEFTSVAAWSPCNGFIAVAKPKAVEILDAVTLKRVSTLEPPGRFGSKQLGFSPDGSFLVQLGTDGNFATWDLQTGGLVGTKLLKRYPEIFSSTHSPDGGTFAFACKDPEFALPLIVMYDFTGAHPRPHPIWQSDVGHLISPIWTHGECLRFATLKLRSITIWQIPFAGKAGTGKVESLPAPDRIIDAHTPEVLIFHPTPPLLAFISKRRILVWDARDAKFLLDFGDGTHVEVAQMSFSSGGRFFACIIRGKGLRVWKESPDGYVPHRDLAFAAGLDARFLSSPNGGSIVTFNGPTIRLLATKDPALSSTHVPTDDRATHSLEFFQGEELAAVARMTTSTVTILDLRSGGPRSILNVGAKISCLRVTGSTLVTVGGGGNVVTWSIPTDDCASDVWASADNTDRTTWVDYSMGSSRMPVTPPFMSISPDLNYLAIAQPLPAHSADLALYDLSFGKYLTSVSWIGEVSAPWFTPERQLLYLDGSSVVGWAISGDGEFSPIDLEELPVTTTRPPGGFPWESTCGYEVKDDEWVLDSAGKRVLWLPHYWRSGKISRKWHGRFLGLLQHELPEAVILEFHE